MGESKVARDELEGDVNHYLALSYHHAKISRNDKSSRAAMRLRRRPTPGKPGR
jgi:hypothetical protein